MRLRSEWQEGASRQGPGRGNSKPKVVRWEQAEHVQGAERWSEWLDHGQHVRKQQEMKLKMQIEVDRTGLGVQVGSLAFIPRGRRSH